MRLRYTTAPLTLWRLLLLTVALLVVCPAVAQNNPFKIDDRLYDIYRKAEKVRFKTQALELFEQMYSLAEQLGDRKAQCIALVIPVRYYYQIRTVGDTRFFQALQRLEDCSKKYGYIQYFYYAVSTRVNYLISRNKPAEALLYMDRMAEYARRHNHVYGIYSGLKDMGQFHRVHAEFSLAIDVCKQAIELGSEYLPDQDMAQLYRRIAECYEELFEFGQMYDWAQCGLAIAKTVSIRRSLLADMCLAKFFSGDYEAFRRHLAEFGEIDRRTKEFVDIELLAAKAISDGDADRSIEIINTIPDRIFDRKKVYLWLEVSRMMGDYALLANNQRVYYEKRINTNDSVHSGGFSKIDSRFINMWLDYEHGILASEHQRLENERQLASISNANLQLANTRLMLHNSSLELSRTKSRDAMVRLSYSRKRLEAERLRGEINAAKAQRAFANTLFASAAACGAILLIAVALYLRSRNRLMARLKTTNRQLELQHSRLKAALYQAQALDRAKSGFIQNMGVEIRRPLEATVRSARLIADARRSADPQQLDALNRRLHDNTQTMLGIVAGVLDKANKL